MIALTDNNFSKPRTRGDFAHNQLLLDRLHTRVTAIVACNFIMPCAGLCFENVELSRQKARSHLASSLPPFRQAAEGCCVASAPCVSETLLTPPRLSASASGWTARRWWRLFAAPIHPPTPTSASWRKLSATHSDASRCCARGPAVSTSPACGGRHPEDLLCQNVEKSKSTWED